MYMNEELKLKTEAIRILTDMKHYKINDIFKAIHKPKNEQDQDEIKNLKSQLSILNNDVRSVYKGDKEILGKVLNVYSEEIKAEKEKRDKEKRDKELVKFHMRDKTR